MLDLQRVDRLASWLGLGETELREIADNVSDYVTELSIWEATRHRSRNVVSVDGALRDIQNYIYKRVLLPKLIATRFSHGCVRGRSILTNASMHRSSLYVYSTDIANCYPSIRTPKIFKLFQSLRCSPDVASVLTKLCSYEHHLALGLVTSPILANEFLRSIDERLGTLCRKEGLVYTRFVDDIVISGNFPLGDSFVAVIVNRVLAHYGLRTNSKTKAGPISKVPITKVIIRGRRPDVTPEYLTELVRQIRDHASLSHRGEFIGPFYTEQQLLGRINFVGWIRPSRKGVLLHEFRQIDWRKLWEAARAEGLISARKIIQQRELLPPDFSRSFRTEEFRTNLTSRI